MTIGRLILGVALVVFAAIGVEAGPISDYTLADLNSTVHVDLSSSGVGMDEWLVNGVSQLHEQSFWYRVGNTPVQRINLLPLTASNQSAANNLTATYSSAGNFSIDLGYTLYGSGPGGGSDLGEMIRITNTSGAALDFHFYQYVDLDLQGTPWDSGLVLSGDTTPNTAAQIDGTTTITESETVDTPRPSRWQADHFPTIPTNFQSGVLDLSNTTIASDGNLTWAFQWDRTIAAGSTLLISKDKTISVGTGVPEPSMLALLAAGTLGLLACAWRRRSIGVKHHTLWPQS
jgi:hypothetical protein